MIRLRRTSASRRSPWRIPDESWETPPIERIFSVTDALGISREALVIPLRTEAPGRIALMKDGKLEIVVDRDGDFEDWLTRLEASIRSLMDLPESEPD